MFVNLLLFCCWANVKSLLVLNNSNYNSSVLNLNKDTVEIINPNGTGTSIIFNSAEFTISFDQRQVSIKYYNPSGKLEIISDGYEPPFRPVVNSKLVIGNYGRFTYNKYKSCQEMNIMDDDDFGLITDGSPVDQRAIPNQQCTFFRVSGFGNLYFQHFGLKNNDSIKLYQLIGSNQQNPGTWTLLFDLNESTGPYKESWYSRIPNYYATKIVYQSGNNPGDGFLLGYGNWYYKPHIIIYPSIRYGSVDLVYMFSQNTPYQRKEFTISSPTNVKIKFTRNPKEYVNVANITVYDGKTKESNLIGSWDSSDIPTDFIQSSGQDIHIKVISNIQLNTGFSFYSNYTPPPPPPTTINNSSNVSSPQPTPTTISPPTPPPPSPIIIKPIVSPPICLTNLNSLMNYKIWKMRIQQLSSLDPIGVVGLPFDIISFYQNANDNTWNVINAKLNDIKYQTTLIAIKIDDFNKIFQWNTLIAPLVDPISRIKYLAELYSNYNPIPSGGLKNFCDLNAAISHPTTGLRPYLALIHDSIMGKTAAFSQSLYRVYINRRGSTQDIIVVYNYFKNIQIVGWFTTVSSLRSQGNEVDALIFHKLMVKRFEEQTALFNEITQSNLTLPAIPIPVLPSVLPTIIEPPVFPSPTPTSHNTTSESQTLNSKDLPWWLILVIVLASVIGFICNCGFLAQIYKKKCRTETEPPRSAVMRPQYTHAYNPNLYPVPNNTPEPVSPQPLIAYHANNNNLRQQTNNYHPPQQYPNTFQHNPYQKQ